MKRLSPLHRKLLRDLWRQKGQAIAIASVIAAGVALHVLLISTMASLEHTRDTYYAQQRFGDLFAGCVRAPKALAAEFAAIPGVLEVQTRVIADVSVDLPNQTEPLIGRLVSIPIDGERPMNQPLLVDGRWPRGGDAIEILVSAAFAGANDLGPGDRLAAVLHGAWSELEIVGLAESPEYVYPIRPGEMLPDTKRFAVIWIPEVELASAFDLEGAFNDLSLRIVADTDFEELRRRVDLLLEDYGGFGAIPRSQQTSNWYLNGELDGLAVMGRVIPVIFLMVAAFLLNVVLGRLVATQREQIAALKALGYSDLRVGFHYLGWGMGVASAGCLAGIAVGIRLGHGMTEMYTAFFHFPILIYRLPAEVVWQSLAVGLGAAALGTLIAVRRAVSLPPAEAMRPEPPTRYRRSLAERFGFAPLLSAPARMVLRNIERNPGRSALSVIGIAMSGGLLVLGSFNMDAVDEIKILQFDLAQRFDLMVAFAEHATPRAESELAEMPGVLSVEGFRSAAVRLRHGSAQRTTAITGLPAQARLQRIVQLDRSIVDVPPSGLLISAKLAEVLDIGVGEMLTVEFLEGRRPVIELPVAATLEDSMGLNAWMDRDALHRVLGEDRVLSGAWLEVDPAALQQVYRQLDDSPAVAGVLRRTAAIESLDETFAEMMAKVQVVNVAFAVLIAFAVIYNAARVSLSERARELATLRVMGFTIPEISSILLGEIAVVAIVAVPLGLLFGWIFVLGTVAAYDTEVWRMPAVISSQTMSFASVTVIVATIASSLVVRRKLDQLDLISVLKTRE